MAPPKAEQAGSNEAALVWLQRILSEVVYEGEIRRDGAAERAVVGMEDAFSRTPGMQGDYRITTDTIDDEVGEPVIRVAVGRPSYRADRPNVAVEPYQVGVRIANEQGRVFVFTVTVPSGDQVNEPARPRSEGELSPPQARLRVVSTGNQAQPLSPGDMVSDIVRRAPDLTEPEREGLRALARVVERAHSPELLDDVHGLGNDDLEDLNCFLAGIFNVRASDDIVPDTVPSSLGPWSGNSINLLSDLVGEDLGDPGPSQFARTANADQGREVQQPRHSFASTRIIMGAIQRVRGLIKRRRNNL